MSADKDCAFVIEGKMALPYQYFAGAVGSKFIVSLRDEKQILGVRCARCNKTFVPPRQTCERCFAPLTENWVEVGPAGEVAGFTVVRYAEPYQPKEPPYVLALIKLDGADTRTRPGTFLFNGGPGAASAYLQFGAVGPWRLSIDGESDEDWRLAFSVRPEEEAA